MKFRVAVLDDSIHTQCFAEVADSIEWALKELGHEVERAGKPYLGPQDVVNILFGMRPGEWSYLKPNTIIYNGEQATPASLWGGLHDIYKRFTVWDYSHENAKRYPDFGLRVPQVVRPGWCPLLEGRVPQVEKDHDVVFFGSLNDRRRKVLADLRDAGMSVLEVPFGLYGAERDAYLARARIAVNVHFYENSIFESVRCSYLMHNGIRVVTERSAGDEEVAWLSTGVDYEQLVGVCESYIKGTARGDLDNSARGQLTWLKHISLLDDVQAALEVMVKQELAPIDVSDGQGVDARLSGGVQVEHRASKPQLTLSMIVKNERDVIERCLASVKPYISHWAIVDTGSTDGTQEIIREFMADVPGTLHERPWKEFDGSRTEAIEFAQKECDGKGWLLFIDADEVLKVTGDLVLLPGYDAYTAIFSRCPFRGCQEWARTAFAKADKPWFYEMPRHEGLTCRGYAPSATDPLDNVFIFSTTEGARAKEGQHERYLRDAQVLETWAQSHPDHARCRYYIAQSYRDAATGRVPLDRAAMQKAVQNYLMRSNMPGFEQETFSAIFQAARAMSDCGYPWDKIQATLLRAYAFRPTRAEPLVEIAKHYMIEKQWALCELFARKAVAIPFTRDSFMDVDSSAQSWRGKDALATSLTYLNGVPEALELFREILPLVPPEEEHRVLDNIAFCEKKLGV